MGDDGTVVGAGIDGVAVQRERSDRARLRDALQLVAGRGIEHGDRVGDRYRDARAIDRDRTVRGSAR